MKEQRKPKLPANSTPKQRALYLAEDNARVKLGGKGFLNAMEQETLRMSFTTSRQEAIYERIMDVERVILAGLPQLKQFQLIYFAYTAYLDNHCSLLYTYSIAEIAINEILSTIKNKEDRDIVIGAFKKRPNLFLYSDITSDPDREVRFITKAPKGKDTRKVEDFIREYSKRATHWLTEALALGKAMQDIITEEGFNVKSYTSQIENILEDIKNGGHPISGMIKTIEQRTISIKLHDGNDLNRLYGIMDLEKAYPNPATLEIPPDRYSYFKNEYLRLK